MHDADIPIDHYTKATKMTLHLSSLKTVQMENFPLMGVLRPEIHNFYDKQ